jgi:branched-chain amino acid transport system substrate-binding protein
MLPRLLFLALLLPGLGWADGTPVRIGLDAEIGHQTSTSDDAIRLGMEIAIDEINASGGVLNGRPLELVVSDNRSVPARGVDNFRALAAKPDLVAVVGGKFSPVVLAQLPLAHELKLPLFSPWSAIDAFIDHDLKPSYTFRLSLRDGWIMPLLFRQAERRGIKAVGLLVPNGSWGRGNAEVAARHANRGGKVRLAKTQWYDWTDDNMLDEYQALTAAGAEAILFVGNEMEGARLVKMIAAQPKEKRLPVLSHWGMSGGDFFGLAGPALGEVDLTLVQSFSFLDPLNKRGRFLRDEALKRKGLATPERLLSALGIAQAYDLTHILANAVNKAGSTERAKIRDALENLGAYQGVIKKYAPPFTRGRHEALGPEQMFMARYRPNGALVRVGN